MEACYNVSAELFVSYSKGSESEFPILPLYRIILSLRSINPNATSKMRKGGTIAEEIKEDDEMSKLFYIDSLIKNLISIVSWSFKVLL